jgi:hypothetical protein
MRPIGGTMTTRRKRRVQRAVAFGSVTLLVGACGARTGLLAPEETDSSLPDAHDAAKEPDAEADVAEEDAVPPIDVIFIDVPVPTDCPDAGSTLIYVLGAANELYSFYPPTLTFKQIGTVSCTNSSSPFSMAVNRLGIAYSVFTDGRLFQISTANAACKSTTYKPNQLGWSTFGMGYASAPDGGDTLHVIEVDFQQPSLGLGTIDTSTFTLTKVGSFQPDLTPECELTGTGDGRLFALCLSSSSGSTLAQIDPATAKIIGEDQLTVGGGQEALAFAFWGGYFWIFTSPGSQTTVTRYDPVTKVETAMTTLNAQIVGAGVSTCAPQ